MTTATLEPVRDIRLASKGTPMNRIRNVVRLHFVNPSTLIVLPWIIMAAILALHMAIWAIVKSAIPEASDAEISNGVSGSASWMLIYMLVIAVQAVNLTFPYALGMSVTRREYALGTGATFVLVSIGNSAAFTVLSYIEQATGGWGLGGQLFAVPYVTDGPLLSRWFVYFVGFAFFFFVGWVAAATYVRWRALGLVTLGVCAALLLVGAAALITWTNGWPAVGEWFVAMGSLGVTAWMLVPTVIAAVGGTLLLRGSTPRA